MAEAVELPDCEGTCRPQHGGGPCFSEKSSGEVYIRVGQGGQKHRSLFLLLHLPFALPGSTLPHLMGLRHGGPSSAHLVFLASEGVSTLFLLSPILASVSSSSSSPLRTLSGKIEDVDRVRSFHFSVPKTLQWFSCNLNPNPYNGFQSLT